MLPDKNSPLRNLPTALDPVQGLFLDGIRYGIEMADIAFSRLTDYLKVASVSKEPEGSFAGAFLDAWAFVDSIHRLRELLQQMPNAKTGRNPSVRDFLSQTEVCRTLRNGFQHLRREISAMAGSLEPIHGVLKWIYLDSSETGRSLAMASGKIRTEALIPVINPVGLDFFGQLDHIELDFRGSTARISYIHRLQVELTRKIDDSLRPQFAGQPLAGGDLRIGAIFSFGGSAPQSQPAT